MKMIRLSFLMLLLVACSDAVAPTPTPQPVIELANMLDVGVQRRVNVSGATVIGWRTSDSKRATVNEDGTLRVFDSGSISVVALLADGDSLVANTEVVVPGSVPEVLNTIQLPKTDLTVGDLVRANANLTDSLGTPIALTERFVMWGSTGATVAVDDSGNVRAAGGEGVSCIIGIINGMARCTMVSAKAPTDSVKRGRLFLTGPMDTLVVGDTFDIQAVYRDADGVEQQVPIVWGSHSPNTARVTLTGEVVALNPGAVTISGIAEGGVANMFQVYVKAKPE